MTRRRLTLTLGVAVGLVGLTAIGFAGQTRTARRQKAALSKGPAPFVKATNLAEFEFLKSKVAARPPVAEPVPPVTFQAIPSPKAQGAALAYQRQIAAAMTRANLMTDHRIKHFQWLVNDPRYQLTGWAGFIEGVEPTHDGAVVTVRISPSFLSEGLSTMTGDCTLEKYALVNGQFRFLEGMDSPDAIPGLREIR